MESLLPSCKSGKIGIKIGTEFNLREEKAGKIVQQKILKSVKFPK